MHGRLPASTAGLAEMRTATAASGLAEFMVGWGLEHRKRGMRGQGGAMESIITVGAKGR